MSDFDYLLNDAPSQEETQDTLQRLRELMIAYKEQQAAVMDLEDKLSTAKAAFNKTAQEDIPNLLLQSGLSQIKTPWGEKVTVKQEVSPTVTDMAKFAEFLDKRGEGFILKSTMELGRLDTSIVRKIQKLLYEYLNMMPEVKTSIHPSTLKKYIRELCCVGEENPGYDGERHIPLSELPDCVKAFTYYKTTIK